MLPITTFYWTVDFRFGIFILLSKLIHLCIVNIGQPKSLSKALKKF